MNPGSNRSGILLVDKPQGNTSHDVVARTRRLAGTRKVGHAGTLDPLATGLLVLGVNSSTRLLTYVVGLDKEYEAVIRLGASTTTDDSEGDVLETAAPDAVAALTDDRIAEGLSAQTGDVLQRPSSVSAIKVDGKRAYARVRGGETVVLDARAVTISTIEVRGGGPVTGTGFWDVSVRVVCSSGTYIRAIARDLGDALGVGGHLTALRRTRIGPFGVAEAHTLETIDADRDLLAPADVAGRLFETARFDAAQAADLRNGKRVELSDGQAPAPGTATPGPLAAIDPDGALIGLFEIRGGTARVLVNFPTDAPAIPTAATEGPAA
ncbi:tRNA pseudouridine(55) synthase TruB [Subtercola boreus]|uniref:tRNA pseudouridine synthase B n=1 Tax=Subtercola boreus TaxID=120213 RepID=A0A3E0VJA1_9MICO|nr:tRNA pseudouridine(55) synthase TruB [Subtercola boreus]RFA09558.1 tRNA pseudouridine(55) synthase TruB [Subtercola boreus]TQL53370.1 tRNA pseudouridine synthase B [Subtercola boreus]